MLFKISGVEKYNEELKSDMLEIRVSLGIYSYTSYSYTSYSYTGWLWFVAASTGALVAKGMTLGC